MSTHKNIDRVCIAVLVLTILLTALFMNGEKLGITVLANEDAESYDGDAMFTQNDLDGDWADNAYTTYITLEGTEGKIKGNGAYFLNGNLVISNGGWYVISGTLDDGSIIVDAYDSSKIWIRIDGVDINCESDACLRVEQADKVFLTLADGSTNKFKSGSTYSDEALEDNTGGTIFSHDDLTINGSGSLNITAEYKHGIDVNDSIVIAGGNISITAPEDGVHVNDSFRFANANLTINAGDDAVHSDGELYIESGTINIESCYEGLEAATIDITGGDITIYPSDDGINATDGSGSQAFMPGMQREQTTQITSGEQNSSDTQSSTDSSEVYVRISGGTLKIINENGRDADGIDSNGSVYIDGGDIIISMPGDGGNNAIDFGSENRGECIFTGGTFMGFGGSAMVEEYSEKSTQCAVLYNLDTSAQAGTTFTVKNADGEEILSYTPECNYSSIGFSSPALSTGETYTVVYGDSSGEVTPESTSTTVGTAGGMGGMMQGGFGKQGNRKFENDGDNTGTENFENADTDNTENENNSNRPSRPDGVMGTPPDGTMGTPPDGTMGTPPDGTMGTPPDGATMTPPEIPADAETSTDENMTSDMLQNMPGKEGMKGFGENVNEIDSKTWITLGAAALTLIVGIIFAMKYKK